MSQSARADDSEAQSVSSWAPLNAVDHAVLVVAAREGCLRDVRLASGAAPETGDRRSDVDPTGLVSTIHPRRSVAADQTGAGGLGSQDVRGSLLRLWAEDLIGFYWVADGYPDLVADDVRRVLRSPRYLAPRRRDSLRVGVYLTVAGELLVLGR